LSQFEYVAVLISIIVGLALTQILRGVGRMVSDKNRPAPYLLHTIWTFYLFCYTALFWWWEFQLASVEWSLSLYIIIIVYATLLYFASLIIQPSNIEGISSFKSYYYEKRHIIYGTWIALTAWDIVDTLAKGTAHIFELGLFYIAGQSISLVGSGIAIWTNNERFHQIFVFLFLSIFWVNMAALFFIIG
jgi:hypothetical protein